MGPALNRRRQQALAALLVSQSVAGAARRSGISERSIFRYLREPAFRRALRSRRADGLRQATNLLSYAASGCVARLMALTDSTDPAVAGPAARALLAQAYAAIEATDIDERLQDVEERLESRGTLPTLPFRANSRQAS